jgi:hypothetical protein
MSRHSDLRGGLENGGGSGASKGVSIKTSEPGMREQMNFAGRQSGG